MRRDVARLALGRRWRLPYGQHGLRPGPRRRSNYGRDRGGSGIITRWARRVAFWGDQREKYDLKSTTKSFGSIITALAFKDKRIDREARVQPILPELGVPQSTSQKKSWLAEIQVKHLLTHTAGFGKVGGFTDLEFRAGHGLALQRRRHQLAGRSHDGALRKDLLNVLRSRVLAPMGIASDRLSLAHQQLSVRPICAASCGASSGRASPPTSTSWRASACCCCATGGGRTRRSCWRTTSIGPPRIDHGCPGCGATLKPASRRCPTRLRLSLLDQHRWPNILACRATPSFPMVSMTASSWSSRRLGIVVAERGQLGEARRQRSSGWWLPQ